MALTPVPGFVTAGEALQNAVGALQVVKPILDDLKPDEGQPADPELTRACLLVERAIAQAEAVR